jgi:hypothetical protein
VIIGFPDLVSVANTTINQTGQAVEYRDDHGDRSRDQPGFALMVFTTASSRWSPLGCGQNRARAAGPGRAPPPTSHAAAGYAPIFEQCRQHDPEAGRAPDPRDEIPPATVGPD